MEFTVDGISIKRFGLIALVRLEPFEKGVILPHEKTYSKVKSERLQLMKACHANFSPDFFPLFGQNQMPLIFSKIKFVRNLPIRISQMIKATGKGSGK